MLIHRFSCVHSLQACAKLRVPEGEAQKAPRRPPDCQDLVTEPRGLSLNWSSPRPLSIVVLVLQDMKVPGTLWGFSWAARVPGALNLLEDKVLQGF